MTRGRSLHLLRSLTQSEAAGGILLVATAALAMAIANSAASLVYFEVLHAPLGPLSVLHWINDGLMALFFLLVGLEVKREFTEGELSDWPSRRLPIIAATAGMIVPAIVYLLATGGSSQLARGWAVPAATDIAFAVGILALVGNRAPPSLKLLLTTIAVVDDVIAITIIALAYTPALDLVALAAAALILMIMFAINRAGVRRLSPYLALALVLWIAVYLSGVHATIAGVLAAFAIPARPKHGPPSVASPVDRIEHGLQPWVAFGVLPLFAFANAGVSLAGLGFQDLITPLALAVAAGLFIGKQAGVFLSIRAAVALGLGARPAGASWLQIYALSVLCGIGFTISLFIGGLAFADATMVDQVKIGVIAGSTLSALIGFALLQVASTKSRH